MTISHAHARNACAHEQSTNIESGAVQWHKQSEQLLDCERESEREKVCDFFAQNRPFATNAMTTTLSLEQNKTKK